jgi:MFS transporter, FHS family, glucose/mannose:H+ symporter
MNRHNTFMVKTALLINYAVFSMFLNLLSIFIMQSITVYHASAISAGALESYQNLTQAAMAFIAFSFLLKLGYKRAMIITLFIMTIVCFFMPILNTYWAVKMFLVIVGISFVLVKISIYASVGIICNTENAHVRFIVLLEGCYMIAGVISMWIFSEFIRYAPEHWMFGFWVLGIFSLLGGLFWLIVPLDESAIQKAKSESFLFQLKEIGGLFKRHAVIMFAVMIFIYELLEQGIGTWLPTFYNYTLSIPNYVSIQIAILLPLCFGLGRICSSFVLKKLSWQLMFFIGFIASGILIFCSVHFSVLGSGKNATGFFDVPKIAYLLPLMGFFLAPIYPALCSLILSHTPKEKHVTLMSLILIVTTVACSAASRYIGIMFELVGGNLAIESTIIPIIVLIFLIVPYSRLISKKVA